MPVLPTRRRPPMRIAAVVLCALTLTGCLPWRGKSGTPGKVEDFVIATEIDGLYPGVQTTTDVGLWNPNGRPLTVTRITTKIADASRTCRARHLVIDDFAGRVIVPADGTAVVQVGVSLSPDAPESCQGATFPLVFSGKGTLS